MTLYQNFIDVDIGKFNFVVSIYGDKITAEYENSSIGIARFIEDYQSILTDSLTVIEATGGYELELIYSLFASDYKVHRADSRKLRTLFVLLGVQ